MAIYVTFDRIMMDGGRGEQIPGVAVFGSDDERNVGYANIRIPECMIPGLVEKLSHLVPNVKGNAGVLASR